MWMSGTLRILDSGSAALIQQRNAVFPREEFSLVSSVSSFEMLMEEVWLAYL